MKSFRRTHTYILGLTMLAMLAGACPDQASGWRSALFPGDWTPAFTTADGHFLHDFSYAGYRNGEAPVPTKAGSPMVSVTDFGADPTGAADSNAAFQSAIDSLSLTGGVVHIPAGLYRCDDVLAVTAPGTVLRGEGSSASRVFFTRSAGMTSRGHITFQGNVQQASDILLANDGVSRSHVVYVADAGSLAAGDDVSVGWVITDAFVEQHGMTGTWQAFNGQWRSFFRRTIVDIDRSVSPHAITLDVPLRYPAKTRDAASLRRESGYLSECGIESVGVATAVDWDAAWEERLNHAVLMTNVQDCWIEDVASFESPNPAVGGGFHLQCGGIKILDAKRITIANCSMQRPQNRGGGGSGYLYEISRVNEVLIRDSVAVGGRHNFIQNWDFGTSGCVFLRCNSSGGHALSGKNDPIGYPGFCEYHHSLATANLVDSCIIQDGWFGGNRNAWSSGAGHSVTQSVYWNTRGGGILSSWQYGNGYIIGTEGMVVITALVGDNATGTGPADYREGINAGEELLPQSLYQTQRVRRLAQP